MNYAEQNRQILLRYAPDQYILLNTPERVLRVLRAGELVAAGHYIPKLYTPILMLIMVPFVLLIGVLALSPEAEIPIQTTVNGVRTGIQIVRAEDILPFVVVGAFVIFLLFTIMPILFTTPSAKRLNRLWAEGRLVTSQHVEVGKARDSDFRYDVKYEFSAPDGERITGWRNIDHIKARAKQQPTVLMVYKSPREYIVL
ncbi:MAG: hypothetical protein SNJ58_01635 [Aggregatilineales bacterium]